jgi:uncharacterized protein involved in exopolysaccharide biosynthesis
MRGEKSPRDYFFVIIDRRRTIAVIVIAAMTIAFLLSLLLPKFYETYITFYMPSYQSQQVTLAGTPKDLVKPKFPIPIFTEHTIHGMVEILLSTGIAENVAAMVPERTPDQIESNANIDVTEEGIFTIKVQDNDPEIAAKIANSYPTAASQFLETSTVMGVGAEKLKEFIGAQMVQVMARADSAEGALRDFLQLHDVISVNEGLEKLINLDATLRTQKLTTQVAMLENNVKMAALTEQMDLAGADALENLLGTNQAVLRLRAKAAAIEINIAELSQTYTEDHPEIIALRSALQETQILLKEEIEKIFNSYSESINPIVGGLKEDYIDLQIGRSVLQSKDDLLDTAVENMSTGFQNLSQIQYDYAKLKREALMLNRMYNALALKLEEVKFQELQKVAGFVVLDTAEVPLKPSYPNLYVNLLVTFALALLVGILMTLIWESRDSSRRQLIVEEMSTEDLRGVFAEK